MNRFMAVTLAAGLLTAALFGVGCMSSGPNPNQEQVLVRIDYGGGSKVGAEYVNITGRRPTVLDVTRQVAGVATETLPNGEQRVTAIGGYGNNAALKMFWKYQVNAGFPRQAPNLVNVSPGDVITWRLQ
jgi:hypothetical protein